MNRTSTRLLVVVLLFGVLSGYALGARAAPSLQESADLLKAAEELIASADDEFIAEHKACALSATLSILTAPIDVDGALARARGMDDPFYSSLAMAGIAAVLVPTNIETSETLFGEALTRSLEVDHWTGSHATSLGFLFQLIPSYPDARSSGLLVQAQETFDAWQGGDYEKSHALLTLSQATIAVKPSKVQALLFERALKSVHYSESIEHLGRFMAKQSPEESLALAQNHYDSRKDWPKGQYFLRAVLIEWSKNDFDRALDGVKKMRDLDRELAAIKLVEGLLAQDRRKEADLVVTYVESLNSDFNWTKASLEKLKKEMEEAGHLPASRDTVAPSTIAAFVKHPDQRSLASITSSTTILFRDKDQASDFVNKALSLAESIRDMGYPRHGSPRSRALGVLLISAAIAGDDRTALAISNKIRIPALRTHYLLEAYAHVNPMPSIVREWPIHFWAPINVSVGQ